ncbi:unnamed protein product [Rotaria sordida]|uniref:Choline transporter-like protein n=1 Tax=Rotaria sordida TaxID=392033 RepID=A0A813UQD9_9BILA|nr:unnamed protein product [Rotaria sordida]CAF1018606.1 unnamed protein product [Rotaria sordida]
MILLDEFAPISIIWLLLRIERIVLASALIEEANKAISYALTTLIWPILTFILNICFIIMDNCNPDNFSQLNCSIDRIRCVYVSYGFVDETFENYFNTIWSHRLSQFFSQHSWLINIFNIFIIYWLLALTIALEEMVLACTFACLSITLHHHLGTIAFGSSFIAIIDVIRTLIDLIKDRMETMNLDSYGKCCLILIKGCLSCVRCCFQFFSRYTYIMTAISGKWFCSSAFIATRLLLKNCLRIFVVDRICAILLYIGRTTITIGSCVFTAYILDKIETNINLHFSWFPVLIIGLSVYIKLSDVSQIESYIISNRLKEIFNKSNDFQKSKFHIINDESISDKTGSKFYFL